MQRRKTIETEKGEEWHNPEILREFLKSYAEEEYQRFSSSLLPGTENIIGVRLPFLRQTAKKIAKEDWKTYLKYAFNNFFEEVMLQGMVIGYARMSLTEKYNYITKFIPKITNWSICDSFCNGLKFAEQDQRNMWRFLIPYLNSEKEFEVRFGAVMLLNYFVKECLIEQIFTYFSRSQIEGYYAKMAVAWAISVFFIAFPERTMVCLLKNEIDSFIYQKAFQKILDSYKVTTDWKQQIKQLKSRK